MRFTIFILTIALCINCKPKEVKIENTRTNGAPAPEKNGAVSSSFNFGGLESDSISPEDLIEDEMNDRAIKECTIDPCENWKLMCAVDIAFAGFEFLSQSGAVAKEWKRCLSIAGLGGAAQYYFTQGTPDAFTKLVELIGEAGCDTLSCFPAVGLKMQAMKAACVCGRIGAAVISCSSLYLECEAHKKTVQPVNIIDHECPFMPSVRVCEGDKPVDLSEIERECAETVSRYGKENPDMTFTENSTCMAWCVQNSVYIQEQNCSGVKEDPVTNDPGDGSSPSDEPSIDDLW